MTVRKLDSVTINSNGAYVVLEHAHEDGSVSRAAPVPLSGDAKQLADMFSASLAGRLGVGQIVSPAPPEKASPASPVKRSWLAKLLGKAGA